MAINKLMRSALKALSYPDINTPKNYKAERVVVNVTHKHVLRPFYKIWDHKISAGDRDIPVRIFSPEARGAFPVLLFFHGGGWVTGNIDSYDKVCTVMARRTRHKVVSVDYRLAPEFPFPAGLEDCYRVAEELFTQPGLLGVTADQITLIGDSAGGNLAAALSILARDRGVFLPRRQILLYPAAAADHGPDSPYPSLRENGADYLLTAKRIQDYETLYRGGQDLAGNPYYAPLEAADLSNQPETLILTAEFDPLRDEGEAFGHKLRSFGNRVEIHRLPDALHGFISLSARFQAVKKSYGYINRFLSEVSRP